MDLKALAEQAREENRVLVISLFPDGSHVTTQIAPDLFTDESRLAAEAWITTVKYAREVAVEQGLIPKGS